MNLPTPSLRLQRLLGGSVAALLTANAFAVAGLVGDDAAGGRLRRPAATGEAIVPTAETPPSVALITTADGRTFMADPSTAEGRRAIEQARRDGGSVRNVTVPPRTSSSKPTTSLTVPRSVGGASLDLPGLVGSLLPKGSVLPPSEGPDDGLLEIDPGLVGGLLQDPVGTATSIVQSTPTTVTSVLEGVTGTVTSIVNQVPLPLPTETTAPPTTAPSISILGQVVTTVVSVVNSVTPTTTAPPTPTTTPVCTLLVVC